jgi:23S rRNA (adenine2030-N6)-methyltransferase
VALVDPAYEVKEDFRRVLTLLQDCHRRWPGGTYLLWHPLIRDRHAERFAGDIRATGIRRIFRLALEVRAPDFAGMRGCGLLIVNLPFGLEAMLAALMPWLWETLAVDSQGRWQAEWLVPE